MGAQNSWKRSFLWKLRCNWLVATSDSCCKAETQKRGQKRQRGGRPIWHGGVMVVMDTEQWKFGRHSHHSMHAIRWPKGSPEEAQGDRSITRTYNNGSQQTSLNTWWPQTDQCASIPKPLLCVCLSPGSSSQEGFPINHMWDNQHVWMIILTYLDVI